jgi:hypothetical protein
LDGCLLSIAEVAKLAKGDGFKGTQAMIDWFENVHGLSFQGYLIEWELVKGKHNEQ